MVLVGSMIASAEVGLPGRPVNRNWPLLGPVFVWPYALAALGCWVSAVRIVRLLAGLVVAAGLWSACVAVGEAWPVVRGERPPAMPLAPFVAVALLGWQAVFGAAALAAALRGRRTVDDEDE